MGSEDEQRYFDDGFPMENQRIHPSSIEIRLMRLGWSDGDEIPELNHEMDSDEGAR